MFKVVFWYSDSENDLCEALFIMKNIKDGNLL